MPSNSQRFFGVVASIAITVGGAWVASQINAQPAKAETTRVGTGLTVTFEGIRNDKGNIIVLVYDDPNAFRTYDLDGAAGFKELPARSEEVTVHFPDLTKGPYAVTAFHDENRNQDLDMNGDIPREGYATSGARDAFDEPSYARAAIASGAVSIQMHYAN